MVILMAGMVLFEVVAKDGTGILVAGVVLEVAQPTVMQAQAPQVVE